MVRCALGLAATLLVAGACDDGKHHLHPEAGRDAPPPPWWQPLSGTAKDWDIQLVDPIDVSMTRVMYDLDLWSLVPSVIPLDYGDGMPVMVPAGTNAGKIAELKGRGVKVICHINTGAVSLDEPDATKFPGYEMNPPDRPDPVKANSVIGYSVDDAHPRIRLLDLSLAGRAKWTKYMFKRFDLAKQIGCDGVEPDRNDMVMGDPGFTAPEVSITDQTSWFTEVGNQAHMRMLSAGMKGSDQIPGQTDALKDVYDWAMPERCAEFMGCDNLRPFINAHKAVFSIDFNTDIDGAAQTPALMCSRLGLIQDGLVKDAAKTNAFRLQCTP